MELKALILLTLLSLTPHHKDTESWKERVERMEIVAKSVWMASKLATCRGIEDERCQRVWPGSQKALAMLLISQGKHESHFAQHIHENNCRVEIGECDAKHTDEGIVPQSLSPWQIKLFNDIPKKHWVKIQEGIEGTQWAAWYAARRLSSAYRACGHIEGAISRYALGRSCEWETAKKRKSTWEKLMQAHPERLKRARDRIQTRISQKRERP